MPICKKCGEEKPVELFAKQKQTKCGYTCTCKACEYQRVRAYEIKHPEKKRLKDSRLHNPEKKRAYLEKRKLDPGFKKLRNFQALRYRKENPHKHDAHMAVSRALKCGALIRPTHCSMCLKETKPQAHHTDYNKVLDVQWLCSACHRHVHSHAYESRAGEVGG